jgi:6,7-dimethyl-8-ribityllumazine synthase
MTYQKVPDDQAGVAAPLEAGVLREAPLAAETRVGLVVSRFNEPVTRRLLVAAIETLRAAGLDPASIDVAWVPGSFELPLAADRLAASGRYAAVICLGAIIKGETTHDRHIATAVATGIEQAARQRGIPITFGVLTCENPEQAAARAGGPQGNKGVEAAEATLAMLRLIAGLSAARAHPATTGSTT